MSVSHSMITFWCSVHTQEVISGAGNHLGHKVLQLFCVYGSFIHIFVVKQPAFYSNTDCPLGPNISSSWSPISSPSLLLFLANLITKMQPISSGFSCTLPLTMFPGGCCCWCTAFVFTVSWIVHFLKMHHPPPRSLVGVSQSTPGPNQ